MVRVSGRMMVLISSSFFSTGAGFGAPENVRLSYATDMVTLKEAINRIQTFMEK